jgi:hypothetical protein
MPLKPIYLRSILILSTHFWLGLPSGLFLLRFLTENLYAFLLLPIRATYLAHATFLGLITRIIFGEGTNQAVPRYGIFSIPLLPSLSYVQISPSAPYSRPPLAYVPPLMLETKFDTHIKQHTKLYPCNF